MRINWGVYEYHLGGVRIVVTFFYTPPCQLQLKARVDLGDQTAEFIPFEVIRTAIFNVFSSTFGYKCTAFWLA
jgi:hypothetical protein